MNPPSANDKTTGPVNGLLITDLDGTLFRSDRTLSETDRKTLEALAGKGIVRAIATGRSLYSYDRARGMSLPVDYVLFSTGAGILRQADAKIIRSIQLDAEIVDEAMEVLKQESLDFMVHRPIPDNHAFAYWGKAVGNPDFLRRIELYQSVCRPLDGNGERFGPAAQLIVILPPSGDTTLIGRLREKLPGLSIIRATSPLDGRSTWIELFHPEVSKSRTAQWLASHLALSKQQVLSVGNDYNDLDLLEWAGTSFVVDNAPRELKARFPSVASNDRFGFTEAVEKWLAALAAPPAPGR